MSKLRKFLITAASMVLSAQAWAGSITIPNTFTSGTPAKAAEVNDNFNAVKSAVDDNDLRITTNTNNIANKQDRVSGSCTVGSSIRTINADGSVVCEQKTSISAGTGIDVTSNVVSIRAGVISIHASAFKLLSSSACDVYNGGNYLYITNGVNCPYSNSASLVAPLQLPDGVTLTQVKCGVYDDIAGGNIASVSLTQQPLSSPSSTSVVYITTPTNDSGFQTMETPIFSRVVNNSVGGYMLSLYVTNGGVDFSSIGTRLRVIGCTISYQP